MTSNEKYAKAQGAAFTVLKADDHIVKALFGEIAMTCLVAMVVLLGAVNAKSKSPLVPFLVGCTVIINVLAGWVHCLCYASFPVCGLEMNIFCGLQGWCFWCMSESCKSVWSCSADQLLDSPLDLLGGTHYWRPCCCCISQVRL